MLNIINITLGLGTIVLLIALAVYGALVAGRHANRLADNLGVRRALSVVFGLSFVSIVISIYYSDVAGFLPCTLCWYQRIAMYPIALLSAIALFRHDGRHALPYILSLAWMGLAFGLVQVNLQAGLVSLPEGATCGPGEIACDVPPFVTLGFITIPIASTVAFAFILAMLDLARRALGKEVHHVAK